MHAPWRSFLRTLNRGEVRVRILNCGFFDFPPLSARNINQAGGENKLITVAPANRSNDDAIGTEDAPEPASNSNIKQRALGQTVKVQEFMYMLSVKDLDFTLLAGELVGKLISQLDAVCAGFAASEKELVHENLA